MPSTDTEMPSEGSARRRSMSPGDGQGDDKAAFATEARLRYPHPLPEFNEVFVTWYFAKCGNGFPVEDVRVDLEANAPVCRLFGNERGAGDRDKSRVRLDRDAAWPLLRKLARRAVPAKAQSLHPHDLRHAFVTLSLDAGTSLRDVQDAAGHADPRTTRQYDRARHTWIGTRRTLWLDWWCRSPTSQPRILAFSVSNSVSVRTPCDLRSASLANWSALDVPSPADWRT
jgi:hypothetical protein